MSREVALFVRRKIRDIGKHEEHCMSEDQSALTHTERDISLPSCLGLPVFTADGKRLGIVISEARPPFLLMRQGIFFTHDIYLPPDAISTIEPDRIALLYTEEALQGHNWRDPSMVQTSAANSTIADQQLLPKEEIQQPMTHAEGKHASDASDFPSG
jgi:hypothetical protein